MFILRLLSVLIMSLAITACGGGAGSGAQVYSDSGSYVASVDENGDPVPLMLTSDSEGG